MAKVSYISVPPDLGDAYSSVFAPLYKTKNSSIRWLGGIKTRKKIYKLSQKTLLPFISAYWNLLTDEQKAAWTTAGDAVGYNGFRLFVQDTARRIDLGIIPENVPTYLQQSCGLSQCGFQQQTPAHASDLYSYMVGEISLQSPASAFTITQVHPVTYYQMKRVTGTKSQREPVAVTEIITLPFEVGLSFKSNLTSVGSGAYAKFYADVVSNYQSEITHAQVGFDIPLKTDWQRQTATLTSTLGTPRWYSLFIELYNVRGTLQFDNLLSQHGGTNYGRDFRCNDVDAGFSNYNYQLPASWESTAAVDGASFGSVYSGIEIS